MDLNKKLNFEYEKLKIVNFCSNNPFALSVFFPSEKFHVCCTHPLLYPRLRQLTHFVCFDDSSSVPFGEMFILKVLGHFINP